MKRILNRMIIMVSCMVLIILITACTAKSPNSEKDTDETPAINASEQPIADDIIAITVVTSYGGDDGNRQNYENALRAFEATTGHVVSDNSAISNETWKTRVLASFDDGTEPDVLFFFTGVDSNKLVETNKVVSIAEIRAEYPEYATNMKDGMLAKSPIDGLSYAVPVNGYWEGLYVNKKVLSDCGVAIPDENTTWEQFLNDCQKISDSGYIPIAASLYEVPHYWFEFCVFNNGTIGTHQQIPESSNDEIGSIWSAGLRDIKQLYELGFFPENTTTITNTEADALIAENKAAFMIEGSWKMGWFSENVADINNFTVTYVPGKGERLSTDIIGGLSMGYFITRKAWENPSKREVCVAFVEAMTSDEVVATFGATAVTALKEGLEPPQGANNLVRDALEMTNNATGITVAVADSLYPNARADLFSNIRNVVAGTVTENDAIDSALSIKD